MTGRAFNEDALPETAADVVALARTLIDRFEQSQSVADLFSAVLATVHVADWFFEGERGRPTPTRRDPSWKRDIANSDYPALISIANGLKHSAPPRKRGLGHGRLDQLSNAPEWEDDDFWMAEPGERREWRVWTRENFRLLPEICRGFLEYMMQHHIEPIETPSAPTYGYFSAPEREFTIGKLDAAAAQILCAIDALEQGNVVAAITLAGAAEGMLPKRGDGSAFEGLRDHPKVPVELKDDWVQIINMDRDWLKHVASNLPDSMPMKTDDGAFMIVRALSKLPPEKWTQRMADYRVWYLEWIATRPRLARFLERPATN